VRKDPSYDVPEKLGFMFAGNLPFLQGYRCHIRRKFVYDYGHDYVEKYFTSPHINLRPSS
jgi:hypothetical protein